MATNERKIRTARILVSPDGAKRQLFVNRCVAKLGGMEEAARALGVTETALWRWANLSLSVEAAIVLAEQLGIPYGRALKHATRRLAGPTEPRVVGQPYPRQTASSTQAP